MSVDHPQVTVDRYQASFLGAVRAEIKKVFSIRTWWILSLSMFLYITFLSVVFAFFVQALADSETGSFPEAAMMVYTIGTSIGYVFPFLLGALACTTEFRTKTIISTFLSVPSRNKVLSAKAVATVVVGIVVGFVGVLSSVGAGGLVLSLLGEPTLFDQAETWFVVLRMLGVLTVWALIGLGLGVLVQNQIAVILIVVIFTQFIEPMLRTFAALWSWASSVGQYLPGAATDSAVGAGVYSVLAGEGASDGLTQWQGGLVLVAYAAVLLVIGAATSWRKDF